MLEIKDVFNKEVTGYTRNINFTYNGEDYGVLLSWSEDSGFEDYYWHINGKHSTRPSWVKNYKSVELDEDENEDGVYAFCYDLDAAAANEVKA